MINLIIVDDEETTRDSLVEFVPWNELGIDAVKTAKNGLDALSLVEQFTPSIMLCDVRMPKMDGIELAKVIRQQYPNCEIIFLSGYSDKEYLKSAIQVSAVDYLEKPIDIEVLKSVFGKLVQKLKDDIRKASDDERLKSSFSENIHLLRQEMLLGLISEKADFSNLTSKYGPEIIEFLDKSIFTVISAKLNWISTTGIHEKSLHKNTVLKALNNIDLPYDSKILAGFTGDNNLVIIHINETDSEISKCHSFHRDILSLLQKHSSGYFTVSLGCSLPANSMDSIPISYKSTLETLIQEFYQGTDRVFYPIKGHQTSYALEKELITKFRKLLRDNSIDDAINQIRKLTRDISSTLDPDICKIKDIYFNLIRVLLEVAMKWDSPAQSEDSENKYIWQEIDSQLTLSGLSEFLISNIEAIYKKADDEASVKKITEIKKYILANYTDNQISIQSISENTFLSQTYLCAFFKKSTGKTLNEYITELRIEKAKELLNDSRIKLYDITSSIGFSDTNYFSTLFKRYTGLTPSEFRERKTYDKRDI